MADETFRITGRVLERATEQGIRGLRVEAWDRDTRYHDMLGVDFTDRRGRFRIRFDSSYFGDFAPDRLPDVYFRVLQADVLLRSTEDEVIRNLRDADAEVTILVELPAQPAPKGPDRVGTAAARRGVSFVRKSDFRGIRADLGDRVSVARGLAGELLRARLGSLELKPLRTSSIRTGAVFDQDVGSVQETLAARQVEVNEVKPYSPGSSTQGLVSAALFPARLKPGQRVDLYEENGKVRYFAVVSEPKAAEQITVLRGELETIRADSAEKDRRIAALQDEVKTVRDAQATISTDAVTRLQDQLAQRDRQIEALQTEVKAMRRAQTAVSPDAVRRLETELAELRRRLPSQ